MSRRKILEALSGLYPHCKHFMPRQPEQVQVFLTGYLKVLEAKLGDLDRTPEPAKWVATVCDNWLKSLTSREFKFPAPDQLANMAEVYRPKSDKPKPEPWAPLNSESYNGLTMADKWRHCQILGMEFRKKAGFMRRDVAEPYDPEAWAKYTPLAEQAEAEAKRLGVLLRDIKAGDAHGDGGGGSVNHVLSIPFMSKVPA